MSYLDFDFPHTRFFESDLRELIKQVFIMNDLVTNFVSINAIKYADPIQWDITKSYEKNTVVIDGNSGVAYISVRPVPPGIGLTREQYWTKVFDLSIFIVKAGANFANSFESEPTVTATLNTAKNNWLVWDSYLYQALTDIHPGDRYVPDGNIKRATVEDFYNLLKSIIDDLEVELDTERESRIDGDASLHTEIVSESVERENADVALQTNIDQEIGNREAADTRLQAAIDSEAASRINADSSLNESITYTNNRINTQVLFNLQNREFLICGDSYNDEAGEWGDIVKTNLGISNDKWHNVSVGGAGFVSNGQVLFINQIMGYEGNRNLITDIIVCGGANDSTTDVLSDIWWNSVRTNMVAFNEYVKANYPYATVSLGFIAGSLDWGEGGVVYGRTYKARETCRYFYESIASTLGWNVLHNVNLALSTNLINISSDKLHPSAVGQQELGTAITQAYLTGRADILRPPTNACLEGVLLGNAQFKYEVDNERTTLHITSDFYLAFSDGTTINNAMIIAYTSDIGFNIPYNVPALARLDNFDNQQYQFIPCRLLFTENSVYIDLQSSNLTHSVTAGNTGYLRLADIDIVIPTKIIP